MHRLTPFVASLMVAFASVAHAQDFDLSPAVGPGNKIVTNAFEDATETEVPNVRVFAYAFGEVPGQPYFLPDPGFHPLPGSGFASGSSVGFALRSTLSYWDGAGSPTFAAPPPGTSVRLDFGASTATVSGSNDTGGYLFGAVDASGEFDDHLETFLQASGGGTPAEGVYLFAIAVTSDAPGVTASDPAYLLFANGDLEDELDAARLSVRDAFAPGSNLPGVPEPSTALLLAGVGLLGRRR